MVGVEVSGPDMAAMSRWMKAEHPDLLKATRKTMREAAKPILDAERAAVRSLKFSTTVQTRSRVLRRTKVRTIEGPGRGGGSGAAQRAAARGTTNMATAAATGQRLLTAKAARKIKAGAGLRDTVARGMRVTYSDQGKTVKATVKTSSTQMPPGQKNLPRLINNGRWRHPVFPKKGTARAQWTWVYQSPDRVGWWWRTAQAEIPAVTARMATTMQEVADLIAKHGQDISGR